LVVFNSEKPRPLWARLFSFCTWCEIPFHADERLAELTRAFGKFCPVEKIDCSTVLALNGHPGQRVPRPLWGVKRTSLSGAPSESPCPALPFRNLSLCERGFVLAQDSDR
jgi:hypothetical protein